MNCLLVNLFVFLAASPFAYASNPMFGYTHLLPSPLTLPAGRLVYGTEVAYGVTDFAQVGTNIVRDVFRFWNLNLKLSMVDAPVFAIAPTLGFENYNLHDISSEYPDMRVTSWLPGLTMAAATPLSNVVVFAGGNLNITKTDLATGSSDKSGAVRGASLGSDISWAYNPQEPDQVPKTAAQTGAKAQPRKRQGVGNVLSTGATYDVTYRIFGVGISHHWQGFHLGIHWYPNATKHNILPIVSGGGSVEF